MKNLLYIKLLFFKIQESDKRLQSYVVLKWAKRLKLLERFYNAQTLNCHNFQTAWPISELYSREVVNELKFLSDVLVDSDDSNFLWNTEISVT